MLQLVISATACAGQLALALIAFRRTAQSRLAVPLVLLFLDCFVWNLASLLELLAAPPVWGWLDHSASPLTVPLTLEFVLAFVGQQRRFARIRLLLWIPFVALSLLPTAGLFSQRLQQWDSGGVWAGTLAACAIPAMTFAILLLVQHLRDTDDLRERSRARLLLAGAALGTTLGLCDLAGNFWHGLPSDLGALGFLGAGALTLFAVTRKQLLESDLTRESVVTALALSIAGVAAYLTLFKLPAAPLVLGVVLVTLALVAVVRRFAHRAGLERARTRELATLGRFSAQMAHDFKNPLAALKGAAQFLARDLGEAESQRAGFVQLMLEQIDRLEQGVATYQRLARVEPSLQRVQINDLAAEAAALQGFATGERLTIRTELAADLPACSADRALLVTALQNLLRNAGEAMTGGTITLRTALEHGSILIRVEDTGPGMDARTREQAFDDFFSTKALGTGLGLSFVRRVLQAHGGTASIDSQLGHGTVVSLRLPLDR